MQTLDLGLIGNGAISALINERGDVVWACLPRFDSEPVFSSLVHDPPSEDGDGRFSIDIAELQSTEQAYVENTAVLVTRLTDRSGGVVEISDFAPRFEQFGRVFCPTMLIRQVRRIAGHPRIRIRVRPTFQYGEQTPLRTSGSHHVRFVGSDQVIRLTTDASITAILDERFVLLDEPVTLLLGPDESLQESVGAIGRRFAEQTTAYWRHWVRALAIPFEWQDVVIRSAITLKLNAFQDTGAIVAAMTTSIPEAAGSQRNWDYRYCWIRDAYFVVDALNRLGATHTMERYLTFMLNLIAAAPDGRLQPLYSVTGGTALVERDVPSLHGFRGMGPVRVGNDAFRQVQHDVYGSAILAVTHAFFDQRLEHRGDAALFARLEVLGDRAAECFDRPDAGLWELRERVSVHTFSSVMCWAGCDRLARIARHLGLWERAEHWRAVSARMHAEILSRCWSDARQCFVSTMDGTELDASLLRLHEVGFVAATDWRFVRTVDAIGAELKRGPYVYRYLTADDFGEPENAFLACTFWYINALAASGRDVEARVLFDHVLSVRNPLGLLAEHIDPSTHEQWGNFVQTYSMVGLIASAMRLSAPWDGAF
ncbi:MAG: glycoside hydrolase family 15 protein [Gemmatimonadaceae bacterium]|nr:glycoside hydrolase family 15 protein [Gemmatimonadaceae bacterium]